MSLIFVTPNASRPYHTRFEQIWSQVPAAWRDVGPLKVRFVTRAEIDAAFGVKEGEKPTTYGGFYLNETAHILWRMSERDTIDLFTHEALGHALVERKDHAEMPAGWGPFYAANRKLMPTEYAMTNAREGWAEVAARFLWPKHGALHPTVHAFAAAYFKGGGPVGGLKVCPACKRPL
jgi:hypothetical protein